MDRLAGNAHGAGLGPEAGAAAVGADQLPAEGRQTLLGYLSAFERGEDIPEPPADLLGRLDQAVRVVSEPDDRKRASGV